MQTDGRVTYFRRGTPPPDSQNLSRDKFVIQKTPRMGRRGPELRSGFLTTQRFSIKVTLQSPPSRQFLHQIDGDL